MSDMPEKKGFDRDRDIYKHGCQTLIIDRESDYLLSGEDVDRLSKIVSSLKNDWPEMADIIQEVIDNLVEI